MTALLCYHNSGSDKDISAWRTKKSSCCWQAANPWLRCSNEIVSGSLTSGSQGWTLQLCLKTKWYLLTPDSFPAILLLWEKWGETNEANWRCKMNKTKQNKPQNKQTQKLKTVTKQLLQRKPIFIFCNNDRKGQRNLKWWIPIVQRLFFS